MQLLDHPINRDELKIIANERFITLVKAVVDIEKEILVVDADLHADQEAFLIDYGSRQQDLWGINLLVDLSGDDFIQFDSMINLRPNQGNMTRSVEDNTIKQKIRMVVNKWITQQ